MVSSSSSFLIEIGFSMLYQPYSLLALIVRVKDVEEHPISDRVLLCGRNLG